MMFGQIGFFKADNKKIASIIHINSSPMVNEANGMLSEGIKAHIASASRIFTLLLAKNTVHPKYPLTTYHSYFTLGENIISF